MVEESVHLHMGQNNKQPENRKEVYLMWEKVLTETVSNGKQQAIIDCLINSLENALADIPKKEYDEKNLWKCQPTYKEIKKQFFKDRNILVPEMEMALQPHINRELFVIWKKRLYIERNKIIGLLKIHTKWYFDKEETKKVEF